jgi:hypothetical protein
VAAGNSGLLTSRIGNPSLSRLESGFPAVTEPPLDHDYYLMATYWEEPQPNWRADDSAGASLQMKGTGRRPPVGIATDSVKYTYLFLAQGFWTMATYACLRIAR